MTTSKKFSVGTGGRAAVVAKSLSVVPGPGAYKESLFNKSSSPKFGFGSGGRSIMNSTVRVPGPGSYKTNEIMGKEGAVNSMHAKLEYKPIQ